MKFKDEMESKLDVEYARQNKLVSEGKPTPLPKEVNKEKINQFYHDLYTQYWDEHSNI